MVRSSRAIRVATMARKLHKSCRVAIVSQSFEKMKIDAVGIQSQEVIATETIQQKNGVTGFIYIFIYIYVLADHSECKSGP